METITHKTIPINSLNIHVAELGQGPTILFLHGFPQLWYTYRHQILHLSSAGYRAIAPDLRGFGDSTGAPTSDSAKFTTLHVVGDLVALIDAVAAPEEEGKVFVVGHDWGAIIAWALCIYRPDKVKGLVNMSVPFTPRNLEVRPVEGFRRMFGEDFYIVRFQEPGSIEAEFAEMGTERVIRNLLTRHSPKPLMLPKGDLFGDSPDNPTPLPSWLSEKDLAYYTAKYNQTGFTGALNYYRAMDLNWELTAPWMGAKVKVPVKFIVGDMDLTYNYAGVKEYIHNGGFKNDVQLLVDVVVLKGVGHFLHEEKPDEINKYIQDFFDEFSTCP